MVSVLRLIRRLTREHLGFWEQPRKELAGWLIFDDPFIVFEGYLRCMNVRSGMYNSFQVLRIPLWASLARMQD